VEEADITGYVTFWNKLKFLFTNKLYIAQFHLSLNNVVSTKIKVKK